MWVRPGEQMIPVADMPKSPFKRKRYVGYTDLCCWGWVCVCLGVYVLKIGGRRRGGFRA